MSTSKTTALWDILYKKLGITRLKYISVTHWSQNSVYVLHVIIKFNTVRYLFIAVYHNKVKQLASVQ